MDKMDLVRTIKINDVHQTPSHSCKMTGDNLTSRAH